jgi:hypothetical protein
MNRFSLVFTGFALLAGCNSGAVSTARPVKVKPQAGEEIADFVHDILQKSTDAASCRRLIEQINAAMERPGSTLKIEPLAGEQRNKFGKELALSPREVDEVGRSEFTPLDAYALEEAFFFRDAGKALDVATLSPVERAQAALDWTVRTVILVDSPNPAAPPTFVALRGFGNGLERTYVFLALLRQLDLDAALIGDPSGQPSGIWGVALRTDDGMYVFDARLGLPLRTSNGSVATLAQIRNDKSVLDSLSVNGGPAYDVTLQRTKASHVFVAEPLSMLSPRLKFLQGYLPSGSARITSDLNGLLERWQRAAQGAGYEGIEVKTWNSNAPDAWQRALMTFLPPAEGGTDRVEGGPGRRDRFLLDQVPWGVVPPFLLQLSGEPGDRVRQNTVARLLGFRQPGQARDLLLRGRFQEATEQLVAGQAKLANRTYDEKMLEERSREWAEHAREFSAELLRAERALKTDPAAQSAVDEAKKHIDNVWKNGSIVIMYLEILTAPIVNEEITYLLALSKHEQAVRAAYRPGAKKDPAAWETTRKWWLQFLNEYPNSGRVGAARSNLAAALAGEGNAVAAKAEYMAAANLPNAATLERLANRLRAQSVR